MIMISSCIAGLATRYDGKDARVEAIEALVAEGKAMLVCPEQLGGLPTPRLPAEIVGGDGYDVLDGRARVVNSAGEDVTKQFIAGAYQSLKIAQKIRATEAILKENSPSCGSGNIYDGTFTGNKVDGIGVTAALFERHNIKVRSEVNLEE
ncbi:DUF523 domain-containing protein [Bacillus alkalicellulosilyticus]|uniref:DUF523 domain-containing protein n=1 Tax=Alkalihalobacterium alkalicellulosilyticum TaxID=1912214 RepID=UPI00099858B0|nr:DUF523 domain-containing protein [Bacillus alkalicellulosilyticus]